MSWKPESLAQDELPAADQELGNELNALYCSAVPVVIQSGSDERHREPLHDDTKHEEVEGACPRSHVVWSMLSISFRGEKDQQQREEHWFSQLRIPAPSFHPTFLRVEGACPGEMSAQVTVIHAPCGDHRQDDVHDTLQRVVAQEWSAGFEVTGEFGTLKIGGFWAGHTPKTPPFVVPVRDQSHVQKFSVQHSLKLKMSGTELGTLKTGGF